MLFKQTFHTSFLYSKYKHEKGEFMTNGLYAITKPQNEVPCEYIINSSEREQLEKALEELSNQTLEIPLIIGGERIYTGRKKACILPHDHQKIIGYYHEAREEDVQAAIDASLKAKADWDLLPFKHKASIFTKAAELLSTTWRYKMNAATMLCQSKNPHQSEIDVVCELIDFFKFNTYFLSEIYKDQAISTKDTWNRMEYTSLDGFVYAVSPFNFTSIGGNLACAPAMVGNTVLWKPASTAVYSNYFIMLLLEAAGLPKGVINFIPGDPNLITNQVIEHPKFAGFHYTGSTMVFSSIWKRMGNNISKYHSYPRIVGETGGKNFVFAHPLCDVRGLAISLIRGAFEYQGQKCSAASRAYIPRKIWPELEQLLRNEMKNISLGDVKDFSNFMNAVISKKSFDKLSSVLEEEKDHIIIGGQYDDTKGYFIEPTVILCEDPFSPPMTEEFFGPILGIYLYDDEEDAIEKCLSATPYALTGAIFARDRYDIHRLESQLKSAAGNLYINDKPTGAVVGQQPFGGSKASGTNDKAGSKANLMRWMNTKAIKENFAQIDHFEYPFMKKA